MLNVLSKNTKTTSAHLKPKKWVAVNNMRTIWLLRYLVPIYLDMGLTPPTDVNHFQYHVNAVGTNIHKIYFKPLGIIYILNRGIVIFQITHDNGNKRKITMSCNAHIETIYRRLENE
jgi:hypothetical protein